MDTNFTQLEFMNELFTPHLQTFPFLNDIIQKHNNKKFHFIIGAIGGISADNIKLIDKNGNSVKNVFWESLSSERLVKETLYKNSDGSYNLRSDNGIFISTKDSYCPYEYSIQLKLNSINVWFYFAVSLSGAEDKCILYHKNQSNARAVMLIAPEKHSSRISFWDKSHEKEWVVNRTSFNLNTYHTLGIDNSENGEYSFIIDNHSISTMGDEIKPHSHHCYELSYLNSGSGTMTIDGKNYFLDTDSFILIKPNTEHSFKGNTASRLLYIGFFFDNSIELLNHSFCGKSNEISKIIMQLDQELKQTPNNYEKVVFEYQKIIIFTLLRIQNQIFAVDKNTLLLQNAVAEIKKNTASINAENLSEKLGYSYHHFRHLFKKHFGMTINQYITEVKLHYAMQLLRTTDMSVKEIANISGFSSVMNFTDTIKKVFNITPTNYRNAKESALELFNSPTDNKRSTKFAV